MSKSFILSEKFIKFIYFIEISDEELLASFVAAIIHDVDHPGMNNAFHVATKADLAYVYNDISVLENHSIAMSFKLMKKYNGDIFQNCSREQYPFYFSTN
jgi:cAMP-specific phosphodiesterase 4